MTNASTIGWLVVATLLSRPVQAQAPADAAAPTAASHERAAVAPSETTLASPPPADVRGLRMPAIMWLTGVAADQITTYRFSKQYGDLLHEENPLLHGLDRHPVLLVAAGTALDAATGWATYHFLGRRHPRVAKIVFYGAAAYRAYLAMHNEQMMRRALEVRAMTPANAAIRH